MMLMAAELANSIDQIDQNARARNRTETMQARLRDPWFSSVRGKIYAVLDYYTRNPWLSEHPNLKTISIVYQVVNVVLVFASIISFIVSTAPQFISGPNPLWNLIINSISVGFFTLDYIGRLICARVWWRFMIKFLSITDMLSFMPSYIELIVQAASSSDASALSVLRIFRLFRVFRLFRLFKYSQTLRIVIKSVRVGGEGGLVLVLGIMFNILFFSSAIYYAETSQCDFDFTQQLWIYTATNTTTPFQSVAQSFYWNIITITTVGYGDQYPVTPGGKVVACFAAISGVMMLSFPVAIFGTNFQLMYQASKEEELQILRDGRPKETPSQRDLVVDACSQSQKLRDLLDAEKAIKKSIISTLESFNERARAIAAAKQIGMISLIGNAENDDFGRKSSSETQIVINPTLNLAKK